MQRGRPERFCRVMTSGIHVHRVDTWWVEADEKSQGFLDLSKNWRLSKVEELAVLLICLLFIYLMLFHVTADINKALCLIDSSQTDQYRVCEFQQFSTAPSVCLTSLHHCT